jgi:hypothetical protein
MSLGDRIRSRRYAKVFASLFVTLSLVGCGGFGLLPRQTSVNNTRFNSYTEVSSAYESIVPGETQVSDLTRIGFDSVTTTNVEILSYLGVIERFMPRDSIRFDRLDPAVQSCIAARDRCTAFVYRPQRLEQERQGNILLDILGFERTTVSHGWAAEVTLLVENGRVAYKIMSGRPHIEDSQEQVQPLGPLQDLGGSAAMIHTAARVF